jgi:hypothetical protein
MPRGMPYEGLCLSRDAPKIDTKKWSKNQKIYNCRSMLNYATNMDAN